MRRQFGFGFGFGFGVGLLAKIAKNGRSTNLVSPSLSSPFHQRSFSTLSPSHLWRIQNGGSLVATTRFFSNALLHNLPTKCKFPLTFHNTTSVRSFNSLDRRRRSIFRRFTTKGVVLGLIATNVAVFLLWKVADGRYMIKNFSTLITSAFSHKNLFDLIFNMAGLLFFGTSIGRCFGPEYLLKLYLVGGIAGSTFYVVHKAFLAPPLQGKLQGISNSSIPSRGASGAVYAIMLLDVFLFPSKTILLVGPFIIGWDILKALQGDPRAPGSAQLGGATIAAFEWLRVKGRFRRF